jgi:hypothetical protein
MMRCRQNCCGYDVVLPERELGEKLYEHLSVIGKSDKSGGNLAHFSQRLPGKLGARPDARLLLPKISG